MTRQHVRPISVLGGLGVCLLGSPAPPHLAKLAGLECDSKRRHRLIRAHTNCESIQAACSHFRLSFSHLRTLV